MHSLAVFITVLKFMATYIVGFMLVRELSGGVKYYYTMLILSR
jgi:hypothetical protein